MQDLGLQGLRHLADFVQQDRAVLRELELADAGGRRPGEGAALVPEQLALQQFGRQRRAVDLDERRGAARRAAVNLARDHFLADAAFTAQQHADVVVGDAIDHGHDRLHGPARTPAGLRAIGVLPDLRAQALHFAGQRQPFERVADGGFEGHFTDAVGVAGLDHVVDCAEPYRFDDGGRGLAAGEHHHLRAGMREADGAQGFKAVEPGHQHVEQDDVGQRPFAQPGQQGVAAVERRGVVAPRPQEGLQVVGKGLVVVNDRECGAAHAVTNGIRNPIDAL